MDLLEDPLWAARSSKGHSGKYRSVGLLSVQKNWNRETAILPDSWHSQRPVLPKCAALDVSDSSAIYGHD